MPILPISANNKGNIVNHYNQLVIRWITGSREHDFKGTASIKIREIDSSHVKETCVTCSLISYIEYKRKLLVV